MGQSAPTPAASHLTLYGGNSVTGLRRALRKKKADPPNSINSQRRIGPFFGRKPERACKPDSVTRRCRRRWSFLSIPHCCGTLAANPGVSDGPSYAAATDRRRRFGRACSSIRREASRSNSFSPQSGQSSSSRSGTRTLFPRMDAVTVTVCLRIRPLPHVGQWRIVIDYPSTALFEEIRM